MAESEEKKDNALDGKSLDEFAGDICGRANVMFGRTMNMAIVLKTLRNSCHEPLLDILIDYAEHTHDEMCYLFTAASDLFTGIPGLKRGIVEESKENGK